MASRGPNDDGSIADLPWAAVFDPAANVRALSAVQARGFRAATEVVDRFVKMADSDPAPSTGPDGDRVLASWQKLVSQLAQSLRGREIQSNSATIDFAKSGVPGQVCLEAVERGPVTTEVWLHNGGPEDLGKVRLWCSDLLAHDGGVIDSAMVRFEPDIVPMVARSSRGVTMEIDVPDEVGSGCYRGTLLADGYPDIWLPVVLTIAPRTA